MNSKKSKILNVADVVAANADGRSQFAVKGLLLGNFDECWIEDEQEEKGPKILVVSENLFRKAVQMIGLKVGGPPLGVNAIITGNLFGHESSDFQFRLSNVVEIRLEVDGEFVPLDEGGDEEIIVI